MVNKLHDIPLLPHCCTTTNWLECGRSIWAHKINRIRICHTVAQCSGSSTPSELPMSQPQIHLSVWHKRWQENKTKVGHLGVLQLYTVNICKLSLINKCIHVNHYGMYIMGTKERTKSVMGKWQPTTAAIVLGLMALGKLWVSTVHSHLKASWTADRLMPYLASSLTSWGGSGTYLKALYLLKHQAKWCQMDPNGTSISNIHEHLYYSYIAFPSIFRNINFFHLAVQDYLARWICTKITLRQTQLCLDLTCLGKSACCLWINLNL